MFKKEYEYNQRGSYAYFNANLPFAGLNKNWFTFKLRAYHHRLSDGTDIPDNYEAKVQRNVASKQILAENGGQPFTKEFKVKTRHLDDNIWVQSVNGGTMEVNRHP